MAVPNRASFIEHKNMRFLIMDAPSDNNLPQYIAEMEKYNVKKLVRVCEESYSTERVERAGIQVYHWPFSDGQAPPSKILEDWLNLVETTFNPKNAEVDTKEAIAVHCVAGLGRAPVLVAIALMEGGMENLESVDFIRKKRRNAFNANQIKFIEKYRPHNRRNACLLM